MEPLVIMRPLRKAIKPEQVTGLQVTYSKRSRICLHHHTHNSLPEMLCLASSAFYIRISSCETTILRPTTSSHTPSPQSHVSQLDSESRFFGPHISYEVRAHTVQVARVTFGVYT